MQPTRLFQSLMFLVCVCLTALSSRADDAFYAIRGGIPNSQYYFKANITGNQYLFYIGGDLLDGTGLSNPNERWSAQMTDAFRTHFPESQIIETRHAQPKGSWFAQYRTSGGQAVFGEVICSGHLAILELATGDRNVTRAHAERQVEGLVRQISLYRATHSTIVVYAMTPEFYDAYRAGKEPEYITWCEKILTYYNIPSLNLAKYAADEIQAGNLTWEEFSKDGIHPTDRGAKVYQDAIQKFVDALLAANAVPEQPKRIELPKPLFETTNPNGRIIAYERTKFSDGWKSGMESPIKPFRHLLVTDKKGETLALSFTGTDAGLIYVQSSDSMRLEYSIDGKPWKEILPEKPENTPKEGETQTFSLRAIPLEELLDASQEHSIVIRTLGDGTARIGGVLLNGNIPDIYAGMSPLERIDAVYAAMQKIEYTPDPQRFQFLPKTMERLKNGGSLRLVLLGDSVIGNTSGSNFNLLLERDYPTCKIEKITSTRSSTGCSWYQHENRIQSYVIEKNPDFLIIGGISNGLDPEAVRSVIRQVRAQRPDLEILFITPVFGAMRDDHIRNWAYIPPEGSFRAGMKKVCEEEKCAYFDMTAPWWKYIEESGKTYGWFMGDSVHANERGCQIIARLLERYFQP